MNEAEREKWLQWRKLGVGGSDISSLFNSKPYGCAKRVWYEKKDHPPDFPVVTTRLQEWGHDCEAKNYDLYQRETLRKLAPTLPSVDPTHPWIRATPDGFIVEDPKWGKVEQCGVGTWEAKSVSPWWFDRVKRLGSARGDHLRQVNWTTACTGLKWGAYSMFNRDTAEILYFDIDLDPDLAASMREFATLWWQRHMVDGQEPEALPIFDDDRCRSCAFRVTCRGEEDLGKSSWETEGELEQYSTPELEYAVRTFFHARGLKNDAEQDFAAAQQAVKDALTSTADDGFHQLIREAVILPDGVKIYYRTQKRTAFDLEALRTAPPIIELGSYDPNVQRQVIEVLRAAGIKSTITTIREKYEFTDLEASRPLRVFSPKKKKG